MNRYTDPPACSGSVVLQDAAIPEVILEAAIDWMVLLRSGDAAAADLLRLEAWCGADPRHAMAWDRINRALERSLNPIRAAERRSPGQAVIAERALSRAAPVSMPRRRLLRGALALAAVGVGTGLLIEGQRWLPGFTADLRTGTGERRTFTLPDGSSIVLNARSAADVEYTDVSRIIRLRTGELIASAAPDSTRPFTVQTVHGEVRALGTRFLVRQDEARSLAIVLEHSVAIRTAGGYGMTLQEGEGTWFDRVKADSARTDLAGKASWVNGMLSARDESLGEVIAALRAYRTGVIRVSPEAARLRVLGGFPLDDTDKVLESLAQTLPIRISFYGPWLVLIEKS